MQPVEYTVCHVVWDKAASHKCSKKYSQVRAGHVAAPVDEEKRGEHNNDEELACAERHGHAPAELSGEAVFLLVQAEENCQENEGIKELD